MARDALVVGRRLVGGGVHEGLLAPLVPEYTILPDVSELQRLEDGSVVQQELGHQVVAREPNDGQGQ